MDSDIAIGSWQDRVRRTVEQGPVLDVGTPSPFFKTLEWLEPYCAVPYFCSDIRHTLTVDFAADARDLPIRSGTMGAVICQGVAQYVPDPQRVFDEIRRVLRPGGRAYFSLTSVHPYTAAHPGFLGDVVRFTPQSPDAFFSDWSEVRTLHSGGVASTALNYVPWLRRPWSSSIAGWIDRRVRTSLTPSVFVFAVK